MQTIIVPNPTFNANQVISPVVSVVQPPPPPPHKTFIGSNEFKYLTIDGCEEISVHKTIPYYSFGAFHNDDDWFSRGGYCLDEETLYPDNWRENDLIDKVKSGEIIWYEAYFNLMNNTIFWID